MTNEGYLTKCKQERIVNVKQSNIAVIKEPDAETIIVSEITVIGFYIATTYFLQPAKAK